MTTSKKISESRKLMSITLDTLHGIEYGFRQIKVRFFTNLEFKQCWHGIKNAEKKAVLRLYPTHQIGQFPGQVSSSKMTAPGHDNRSSS